jgi:hypothetical protein
MTVSFASEPEPQKKTWLNAGGARRASVSLSAIAGGCVVWKKVL